MLHPYAMSGHFEALDSHSRTISFGNAQDQRESISFRRGVIDSKDYIIKFTAEAMPAKSRGLSIASIKGNCNRNQTIKQQRQGRNWYQLSLDGLNALASSYGRRKIRHISIYDPAPSGCPYRTHHGTTGQLVEQACLRGSTSCLWGAGLALLPGRAGIETASPTASDQAERCAEQDGGD